MLNFALETQIIICTNEKALYKGFTFVSSVWGIDNYDLDAANSPSIEQLMLDELTFILLAWW